MKYGRRTKEQVAADRMAAQQSPTALPVPMPDGTLRIYDYGEDAGGPDMPAGKLRVDITDRIALFMALKALPDGDAVLRHAGDEGRWYRELRNFIRHHGISELPGVTIYRE